MEFESPKNISTNEDSVLSAITVSQNISIKFNFIFFAYHLIKLRHNIVLFIFHYFSLLFLQDNEPSQNHLTTVIVPVAFTIIAIVGIFGNALVIIVVSTNTQMRSTTNLLILNLAVADLLFVCFCVPFTATDYVLSDWPFGHMWCQTVQYLIYYTSYVSIYTIFLMSIDRFMAVVFPVCISFKVLLKQQGKKCKNIFKFSSSNYAHNGT